MRANRQQGTVLIVVLLFLLITTLVSVSSISQMQASEQQAANIKQVSQAFMAAESGLIEAKNFFDNTANKTMWGDSDKTMQSLNRQNRDLGNNLLWQIESVDFASSPGNAVVTSIGQVSSTGISRRVRSIYSPAVSNGNLGAMNIIGGIKVFDTANSNSFQVIGEKNAAGENIGPALATNTQDNYEKIVADINSKDRMANYQGGIKVIEFDDPFGDAEKMNEFIESIKAQYYAMPALLRGTAPSNMGIPSVYDSTGKLLTAATTKITYVPNSIEFKGKSEGAGILVIDGNLKISGNILNYEGLIVVRGQTFEMNGGGTRNVTGSIVFANPQKDSETGEWSFGEAEATFTFDINGGGNATFKHDNKALSAARDLLANDSLAKQLWQTGSGTGKTTAQVSRMMSFQEL